MISWALVAPSDLPRGDGWLRPAERRALAALRIPSRRRDWRLGRFAAKRVVAAATAIDPAEIEVRAAPGGAPDAWHEEERLALGLTLSHRSGLALAAVAMGSSPIGCDLELIEPRPAAFAADWFTARERALLAAANPGAGDRLTTLIWSAKESALKALRVGLRRDTRSVEVLFAPRPPWGGWGALRIRDTEAGPDLDGWWRGLAGNLVVTVAGWDLAGPPSSLTLGRARGSPFPDPDQPKHMGDRR